jgi:glyoxylase-like metal-dependent hydrolase (beta-lactamase superfamily II)
LEVVASPGHTPGHIAYFDTRDSTLIAGDALQTRAGLAVSGVVRWAFPFPALATWDAKMALASAERLRALDPARLAVGHGEVLEAPTAAMEQAITEARRKVTGKTENGNRKM